jgi:hypothetical protein
MRRGAAAAYGRGMEALVELDNVTKIHGNGAAPGPASGMPSGQARDRAAELLAARKGQKSCLHAQGH